ncbi:MAG: DUF4058 family protein [Planctomycetes bacterium]|nr:DUF4058 family protein [Planctomycetota bacterium]
MRCPFPGMDPYLERPALWPDFHDSLITYIRETLQPILRPKYVALTQDRLFVVESDRSIRPDVAVIESSAARSDAANVATLTADEPIVLEMVREEVREPFVQIIEPAAGNRVVTAIEVLSPDNKTAGAGRDLYIQKREEFWLAGTHLVEIDLLRSGLPTVRVGADRLAEAEKAAGASSWRYMVAVTRVLPTRHELYPVALEQRLPRVKVPLARSDPDVVLDLQAAFARTWEAGPYPELLRYDELPLGELTEDEIAFCRRTVGAVNH